MDGIYKTQNSKEITKTEQAEKLIEYGWRILPILAKFFVDQDKTDVKSKCIERNLSQWQISIIIAYRIEMMPYYPLIGTQNCLLTFCEKNLDFVEYYLPFIQRDGIEQFQ